jgi:hypothetical protein
MSSAPRSSTITTNVSANKVRTIARLPRVHFDMFTFHYIRWPRSSSRRARRRIDDDPTARHQFPRPALAARVFSADRTAASTSVEVVRVAAV